MHLAHILRQGNSRINVFMRFQERGVIILWESGVGRGKFTSNPPLLELVEFTQCVLVEVMPYFNAAYLCLKSTSPKTETYPKSNVIRTIQLCQHYNTG